MEEPYFPTSDEAIDGNKEAYARWAQLFGDSDVWGGVLKPNELESALGAAKNHYYYGDEEDEGDRLSQAAAKMAWRIAGNQVFANGNKRTAYWTMREMLDRNGLGHLSPLDHDDVEFADHLIGQDDYGSDTSMTPEQLSAQRAQMENGFLNLWRQRYQQGGPQAVQGQNGEPCACGHCVGEPYQQVYPEGCYIVNPEQAAQTPPQIPEDRQR